MRADGDDVALGHETKMRWNDRGSWVWSEHDTHPPLVSVADFEAVQSIFAGAKRTSGSREHPKHPYLLAGRITCAVCGRKMQGSWNNGRPYYRCKFPAEYAVTEEQHSKTVYVREEALTPGLDRWLGGLFDDDHLDGTCQALADASNITDHHEAQELDLRRRLKECDHKLARYREVLEHGTEVAVIGDWIAEVTAERQRIERQLGMKPTNRVLTAAEVRVLVMRLKDIVGTLRGADPVLKQKVYDEVGVRLTYHPDGEVTVEAGDSRVLRVGVGGASCTITPRQISEIVQLRSAA